MTDQSGSGSLTTSRRLTHVFEFIRELARKRQPVARTLSDYSQKPRPEFLDEWPRHPFVWVYAGDSLDIDDDHAETGVAEPEPIARVRRPRLTRCPKPPRVLRDWLLSGWDDPTQNAQFIPSKNLSGLIGDPITIQFSDDEERFSHWQEWTARRDRWAEAELPAVLTRRLYERIHSLWTLMRREGDRMELVVADGILHLSMPGGASGEMPIEHPVLLQRIRIQFEPAAPEFQFWPDSDHAELHRPLLSLVPGLDSKTIADFAAELEAESVTSFGGQRTKGFLRRLVQGLFVDGEFSETKEKRRLHATIWRDPVVIARPRTAGLATIIESIIEDLGGDSPDIPRGLVQIAGGVDGPAVDSNPPLADGSLGGAASPGTDPPDEIFFSKAANKEQVQIAERLRKSDSVLVQGPPGTGKTHTIANLIGHFLQENQTVLVAAHTSKALRVLRDQVDEQLQPLCLSVLEGDAESREQLKLSVQQIIDRVGSSNAEDLRRHARDLVARYRGLQRRIDDFKERLGAARYSEIEELVIGGEGIRPGDAAKQVLDSEEEHGWVPGPIHDERCSLSNSEIRDLYTLNGIISAAEVRELMSAQPSVADLIIPSDMREYTWERAEALDNSGRHRAKFWDDHAEVYVSVSTLGTLLEQLVGVKSMLADGEPWLRQVLFAGWMGAGHRRMWEELIGTANRLVEDAANTESTIAERDARLPPGEVAEDVEHILQKTVRHLQRGWHGRWLNSITKLAKPRWRKVIADCRTYGRKPRNLEDYATLLNAARLERKRTRFIAYWNGVMKRVSGPLIGKSDVSPELVANSWEPEIQKCLKWREQTWEPFRAGLSDAGFRWEVLLDCFATRGGPHGDLDRITEAVDNALEGLIAGRRARARLSELNTMAGEHRSYLLGFPESKGARALERALHEWNPEAYENAHLELARLEGLRKDFDRRRALLNRLADTAAAWAAAITLRRPPHDMDKPPSDPGTAWRWRQLKQELDRRAEESINRLLAEVHSRQREARRLAGKIIDYRAWAALCDRIGLAEQQALVGFVKTMDKMGKGFGKKVPALKARARELLDSARSAVPVWIMPLSRVYESFDPRSMKFDVVIIDEASQSDVTALAALYLGRRHIIVGDNEQVTPDAIGMRVDDVDRLIDVHLDGIPNSHLYDGQTSIYDLAETSFVGGIVRLREHFRCAPEIIQFSNTLSYNNTIQPLREPSSAGIRPAIVSERVEGRREDKRNDSEAATIASLISACLRNSAYLTNDKGEPTSFGVITLLGHEQATVIGEKLWEYLGDHAPDVFTKHRLLCGTAAQFQGDERDVIFLSMVDGPPEEGRHRLTGDGPAKRYKKRYNVAASRARNQLWVVHSLDPVVHLKEGDLRRRLIQHARDPSAMMRAMDQQSAKTESELERRVLRWLQDAGYRVRAQWPVGALRIDLVVLGSDARRLAVECDGERYHPPEKLLEDMQRQADLERMGWRFARVRGSVFFRDPARAMKPVVALLERMEIVPIGEEPSEAAEETDLLERIRRDAEALRRERETDVAEPRDQAPLFEAAGDDEESGDVEPTDAGTLNSRGYHYSPARR